MEIPPMNEQKEKRIAFNDIVLEYFPDADEAAVGFILWEKTGYPSFFMEGEKSLREQLVKFKEEIDAKTD